MDNPALKKLNDFFCQFTFKKYQKNDLIVKASEEPGGLYFLTKGLVRQYAISSSGDELTINIYKPGSIFPVAWVINDSLSPHYFEASTPVALWVAPKKESLSFLQNEPSVLFDLVKRIYSGLDGYFSRMESVLVGNARTKLIAQLLIHAKRFGYSINDQVEIPFAITQKELAAQSGIARETVSRELQKLKGKGLIKILKNKLFIPNLAALEEELLHE